MGLTQITTGGVDENINIDSNTLKVDGTNNRVGIGTSSPTAPLTVFGGSASSPTIRIEGGSSGNDNARIESEYNLVLACNGDGDQSNRKIQFRNNATDLVTIDSSGNVGIGTSSPSSLLHLESASSPKLLLVDTTNSCTLKGYAQNSNAHLGTESSHDFIFDTNNTERLRIDSSGKVGVGLTPTSATLEVSGQNVYTSSANSLATATTKAAFRVKGATNSSDGLWMGVETSNAEPYIQGANGVGNNAKDILLNPFGGNVGIGTTNPSELLHIAGATNPAITLQDTTNNTDARIKTNNNGDLVFEADYNNEQSDSRIGFEIDGSEKARIDSSGNLAIGVTSPQGPLHVGRGSGNAKIFIHRTNAAANTNDYGTIVWRSNGNNNNGVIGVARQSAENDGYMFFSTASGGTLSERMRIDNVGAVTVKRASTYTTGLQHGLAIQQGSATNGNRAGLVFQSLDGFSVAGINGVISTHSGTQANNVGYLEFYTKPSGVSSAQERMRITSGGALRVGNSLGTNAAGRFQVVEERTTGDDNDCNAYFETSRQDWNIKTYYNTAGTHYHIVFVEQGTERGSIRGSDGSNVTFNQGSDYRWKENIVEMTGAEGIEVCKRLKPSKYNWIENREQTGEINTVDGFIAHEVVEAGVLGAVVGEKDAVNEDGSIKGQLLDYGQMTPVLAAGIKGLIAKIETLEAKVAALEAAE